MATLEPRYVFTAVSDLILVLVSLCCACNPTLDRLSPHTAIGFGLVGIAACSGVVRFGVIIPAYHSVVIKLHKLLSWIASVAGKNIKVTESDSNVILICKICKRL